MDTKMEEILFKKYIFLAKIMGSSFSYFNYVMKSKSKHLQTFKIIKKLFISLPIFIIKKKCKKEEYELLFFCE
jgi:hypothetical protein